MALLVDDLALERIEARQRQIRPLRTLLLTLAGVLYCIGWVAFHVWAFTWSALSFSMAAAAEGWAAAKAARSDGAG